MPFVGCLYNIKFYYYYLGNGHKGPSDTAFLSHSGWIALPAQFLRVFACVSVRLWYGAFARGRESL